MKYKPIFKKVGDTLQKSMQEDKSKKNILYEFLKMGNETLTYEQKRDIKSTIARKEYVLHGSNVSIESEWGNGKWFTKEYRDYYNKKVNSVSIPTFMDKILKVVRQEIEDEVFDAILDTQDEEKAVAFVTRNQLVKMGGTT